jgi:hypothetical protein
VNLRRGTVVLVELDPTVGHEQRGVRPCIVVGDPEVIAVNQQEFLFNNRDCCSPAGHAVQ